MLSYETKTKDELITELMSLRQRIDELEQLANQYQHVSQTLRDRERDLEMFFSQSLDGFFFMMLDEPIYWNDTVDKEAVLDYVFGHQRMTKVNDALLQQYGATRDEFLGLTPNDFFSHNLTYGRQIWREFFDAGRLHLDTDERKLDGTPVWIEGDYICLYDDAGRLAGHFGVQRDVTPRKQTEAELTRYRDHLERVVIERTAKLEQQIAERKQTEKKLNALNQELFQSNHELRLVEELLLRTNYELQISQERTYQLYQISRDIHKAHNEDQMLRVVSQPAIEAGACRFNLTYFDVGHSETPQWAEVVAEWQLDDTGPYSLGYRYHLPDFSFANVWLSQPNELVLIPDMAHNSYGDDRFTKVMLEIDVQAMVIIPLHFADRWVGLLSFNWAAPHQFSSEEIVIYQALMGLVSATVENLRLVRNLEEVVDQRTMALRQSQSQTEVLYRISQGLNQARNETELLQTIIQSGVAADLEVAYLVYIDSDEAGQPTWAEIVATWPLTARPSIRNRFYLPDFSLTTLWPELFPEPIFIIDISTDPRISDKFRDLLVNRGYTTSVIIPLIQSGRWVGLLFFNWLEPQTFSDYEIAIYRALSLLVPPSVENRRIVDNLEKMVDERTKAWRETQTQYQSIFNAASDAFLLFDTEGSIAEANCQACLTYGYDYETLTQLREADLIHPDYYHLFGLFAKELQVNGSFFAESIGVRKDGSLFPVEIKGTNFEYRGQNYLLAIVRDITDRRRAEETLARREAYSAVVVRVQQRLLGAKWDELPYNEILAMLGPITLASRIYIFENYTDLHGRLFMSQKAEWCASGIDPQIDNPALQNLPYDEFFPRWVDAFQQGEIINGLVADFPETERQILEPQSILSILAIPLMVNQAFCGFIGFDDCEEARKWEQSDVSLLQAMAAAISLAKEQQQTKATLRHTIHQVERSKQLMTTVIDATPDWIFALDQEFRFILANKGFASALKTHPKELIGKLDAEVGLPPELIFGQPEADIVGFREDDRTVLAGETLHQLYGPVILADGSAHIFDTYKMPLRDDAGQIFAVLSFARDITERKQMEAQLTQERSLLRTLIDNLPSYIFFKDLQGRFLINNRAMLDLMGFQSQEEVVGKTDFDVFPYHLALKYQAEEQEIIQARKSWFNFEQPYIDHEGRAGWVSTSKVLLWDEQGQPKGVVGISMDITAQKQAEALLKQRLELIEFISQLSSDFISINPTEIDEAINRALKFVVKFTYIERGYIFLLSDDLTHFELAYEWCETGAIAHTDLLTSIKVTDFTDFVEALKRGEVIKRNRADISRTADNQSLSDILDQLSIKSFINLPMFVENQFIGYIGFDSTEKPVDWTEEMVFAFNLTGQMIANALTRKQTDIKLRQAKEAAEAANRAKSEFLANMSHELRTPLNGILGYAQILKRDSELTTGQREGINIIQQSGEHLLTLINDILDLSKVEAGRLELYNSEFHLGRFLKNMVDVIRVRAEEANIWFNYQPQEGLPIAVYGDEKRLRQVLINLLGNAVKFTTTGGVTFKVAPQQDKICFQVEDTGPGISADQLETIFQPFRQVGETRLTTEGTGLGLSISKRLVEAMAGQLMVDSQLGRGSIFSVMVELPAVTGWQDDLVATEPVVVGYKRDQPVRVLVVDDKVYNRLLISNLLKPLGFQVFEAYNGQDAVEKVPQYQPELIVMDLVMPIMDGFQATREIRSLPAGKEVVIIAASASAFEQDQAQSLAAGCNDFIPKPIHLKNLLKQFSLHLDLEWLYDTSEVPEPATKPPTGSLPEMTDIPPAEAKILYELAQAGLIKEIRVRIEQLDQRGYTAFADQLRQLARRYKVKQIRTLLEPYLDQAA